MRLDQQRAGLGGGTDVQRLCPLGIVQQLDGAADQAVQGAGVHRHTLAAAQQPGPLIRVGSVRIGGGRGEVSLAGRLRRGHGKSPTPTSPTIRSGCSATTVGSSGRHCGR